MSRSNSSSSSSSTEISNINKAAKAKLDEQDRMLLGEQVEDLRGRLAARERRIKLLEGSAEASEDVLSEWQAKYDRLWEAHRKLQKTNHSLEDKLLRVVDKFEADRNQMTRDLASQTQKLVQAKLTVQQLRDQTGELQSDLQLAITLLQNKPSSYLSQRMGGLPPDVQSRVRNYAAEKQQLQQQQQGEVTGTSGRKITVPIMDDVQQGRVGDDERVSAAILAKVLDERAKERRRDRKFCIDVGTQTHTWQFPDKLAYPPSSNVTNQQSSSADNKEESSSYQVKQKRRQQAKTMHSPETADVIQILRSISLDESIRKYSETVSKVDERDSAIDKSVSPSSSSSTTAAPVSNILFQASVIRPPPNMRRNGSDHHHQQETGSSTEVCASNKTSPGGGAKKKRPLSSSSSSGVAATTMTKSATFSCKQTDL